ncbi:aromatic ring-hydroxylating oxygenase subunit alpha [Vasconcelosia minhoensis]|uniref:aromatic ring-hydroxylating oxygenase subunit alpha n=1 Tax=Vasconcelosia minhoensis TaxID=3366354 RepID=UPI001882EED2|nr:aromatic ring-hydroxylating dioxygenase subunit alpha [Romeria gracilis]
MVTVETQPRQADIYDWLRDWQPRSLSQSALTLPSEFYSSAELYRLEQQQIFGKYWYYVGHLSQLHGPGSYFTVDIAEQPLVIVQDKAGTLRGFFNICTHRAGPVALDSGQCKRLTCLYHAWSFDLEGNLRGLPDMEAAENFDRAEHALTPVKVETWGPFIFVNLDPESDPLAVQMGELPEMMQRYQLQTWHRAHSVDYWTDTNWKLYVENNTESYHEPTVHPILAKYYRQVTAEARYHYYLQYTPVLPDSGEVLSVYPEGTFQPGLNEKEMTGVSTVSFFPNFAWIIAPNCAIIYLIDPQGPSRTRVRWDWLVPDQPAAKSAENLEPLIQFYDDIQKEDLTLLPEIQKRVQSIGYRPGRLSPRREMGTHLFQELIVRALAAGVSP